MTIIRWGKVRAEMISDALYNLIAPKDAVDGAAKMEEAYCDGEQLGLSEPRAREFVVRGIDRAVKTGAPVDWDQIRDDMIHEATRPKPVGDTLAEWLFWRFGWRYYRTTTVTWSGLCESDQQYWEHEADAVRRAVKRGGFK